LQVTAVAVVQLTVSHIRVREANETVGVRSNAPPKPSPETVNDSEPMDWAPLL
jgi:hypothetical protein